MSEDKKKQIKKIKPKENSTLIHVELQEGKKQDTKTT